MEGKGGKITILEWLVTNLLFCMLLSIPPLLMGIYYIVSGVGMGAGAIILSAGATALSMILGKIFMDNLKVSSVGNCGKSILEGIGKALGSAMNGIKLDEEDKISLMSSVVGLIISAVITKQVNLVISGRILNAKKRDEGCREGNRGYCE